MAAGLPQGKRRQAFRGAIHLMSVQIGIIGGSGLYDMAELTDREEKCDDAVWRSVGPYVLATLRGKRVAFLARHGKGHRLNPSELNYRANIFGMKMLGVEWILSASAVGSLQEQYARPTCCFRISSSIARAAHQHVLQQRASSPIVGFAHPLSHHLASSPRTARTRPAARRIAAAPTSAWKGRSSRRSPNRISIARGAATSSA
jgi:purine nucleoside phosphorylase